MKELRLNLGRRSYNINIKAGLLGDKTMFGELADRDVLIVSNETVAKLYLEQLNRVINAKRRFSMELPDGESFKTLDTVTQIYDALLAHQFSRDSILVALGGGVVGDITGFAAATFQRGIQFFQIPTTLLAQVDSSVGGKTGVNHALGKNMIGSFYQPQRVIIDITTLNSLPNRQLSAGLAEVIKYGLICDAPFFQWLEENIENLLKRDPISLEYAIHRSCEIKADIVRRDEHETDVRALLNFGHTFGHAIETATNYEICLHGEAVAIGMCLAIELSKRHGLIDSATQKRIKQLIRHANLPTELPAGVSAQTIIDLMKIDKKIVAGASRLILLRNIGQAFITKDFKQEILMEMLQEYPRCSS